MVRRPLVSIVDDSESVRESLPDLLHFSGYDAQAFSSAESFLASPHLGGTNCLILDIALTGMSGPDLQRELKQFGYEIPIVFITGQDDQSLRPRLFAAGAAAVLLKPFSDTALLEALSSVLET